MSIILDALKKSDSERQRQSTPGIASIPSASAGRSSSRWFWIIGLLLALNLAAVAFLINRTGESPASPVQAAQSSPAATPALPIERPATPAAAPVDRREPAAVTPQPAQESVGPGTCHRDGPPDDDSATSAADRRRKPADVRRAARPRRSAAA